MREIEFRAWDKDSHRWWTHEEALSLLMLQGRVLDGSANDTSNLLERYMVEQFTGLRDKNGVKIFEGDLIRLWDAYKGVWTKDSAEVVFSHEYVGGWVISNNGQNLNIGTRTHCVEVIGNIHEEGK